MRGQGRTTKMEGINIRRKSENRGTNTDDTKFGLLSVIVRDDGQWITADKPTSTKSAVWNNRSNHEMLLIDPNGSLTQDFEYVWPSISCRGSDNIKYII